MSAIRAVMEGVEARLAAIDGLNTSAVQPENVTTPAAIVGVPRIESYEAALGRGKYNLQLTITVLVSAALDQVGQFELADLAEPAGPRSIFAAIEADRSLDGAAEDAQVVSFRPLGLEEVGRVGYYGGLFVLNVMTSEV